ncbi:hypothetical protein QQP08_022267 [Theobroma cacao]|nr:hypothetical protein QQP08_022267 [Theobroma cacao]
MVVRARLHKRSYSCFKADFMLILRQLPLHGETSTNNNSSIKNIFERKRAIWCLIMLILCSFGNGLAYYNLMLGVGLIEIGSLLITFFMLEKCNRKSSFLSTSLIGGIGCILTWVVGRGHKVPQLAHGLCLFLGIYTTYNILFVYSIKLFPTCMCNFATTTVGKAHRLVGVISPILISIARRLNFFSYGLFGCCLLVSRLLVLFLPETKGKSLSDSMEPQKSLQINV